MRRLDLDAGRVPVAVSLAWSGEPRHRSLRALARGLAAGLRVAPAGGPPLVLALDADLGRSLGWILAEELGVRADLVCLDGLELAELDYVDVGSPLQPANVVPVVVKSLAFSPVLAPGRPGARPAGGGAAGRRAQPAGRTRTGGRA